MSKIEPAGFNVLVEPIEVEAVTKGGVYLPDAVVEKEQYAVQRGTILAVGPLCSAISPAHVGKVALFGRYAGALIEEDGRKYRLIDSEAIKATVDAKQGA